MTVTFHTDGSENGNGFKATWEAVGSSGMGIYGIYIYGIYMDSIVLAHLTGQATRQVCSDQQALQFTSLYDLHSSLTV